MYLGVCVALIIPRHCMYV